MRPLQVSAILLDGQSRESEDDKEGRDVGGGAKTTTSEMIGGWHGIRHGRAPRWGEAGLVSEPHLQYIVAQN